jgi:TRAP-type C4-dicarboxylate transport system permease large subunit
MLLRVPVAIAVGAATIAGLVRADFGDMLYIVPQQTLEGINSPALTAIEFFILAGNLMTAVGMTRRIFDFANAVVGHTKAGLAQVAVLASFIFSGSTGSAVADCAGLGNILIGAMRERGYPAPFACALTVAAPIIGPTLPLSIPLVIYAFAASTSLGRLFLARGGAGGAAGADPDDLQPPIPAMIILIPMLLPIVDKLGISRVHFGLVLTFAPMIGLATPPMGIALFIVSRIARVPYEQVALAMIPLHVPLPLVLLLITFGPFLTLWLPAFVLGPE